MCIRDRDKERQLQQQQEGISKDGSEHSSNDNNGNNIQDWLHADDVAIAAVTAAFERNTKRYPETLIQGDSTKRRKGTGSSTSHTSNPVVMVDPELTTLDNDDEERRRNDELVNKAILETDAISQNADFQQYLNTEKIARHEQDEEDERFQNCLLYTSRCV